MQNTITKGNPLGHEPVGKLLVRFAVPAVISMLVNALYNIVDQIFIGQGVGYLGNAATTIALPISTIMLAVGTLMGAGGSAYAAIKLGQRKEEEAEHTLGNVFFLLLMAGILFLVLGLLFLEPILTLFGATENSMPYAREYASILLLGAPFNMLGIGLSNLCRTDGSPRFSMYSVLIGCILNTILDPLYIFVFHWGVTGAAVATISSQILSAVLLTWYFLRKGKMRLRRHLLRPRAKLCKGFLSLGISSCILQIANTIVQVVMNNSLVYYGNLSTVGGDMALSAMGIVTKVNMIMISICVGLSVGSQPIIGFNRGAGQYRRVRKTYLTAAAIGLCVTTVCWALCQLFPEAILSLFGDQDQVFNEFAVRCMRVFLLGICCAGLQSVSTGYFQATGQPLKATILSSLRQIIILIPLVLVMPLFFGLDGILYAGPVSDITTFVIVLCIMIVEMKRLNGIIAETERGTGDGVAESA